VTLAIVGRPVPRTVLGPDAFALAAANARAVDLNRPDARPPTGSLALPLRRRHLDLIHLALPAADGGNRPARGHRCPQAVWKLLS